MEASAELFDTSNFPEGHFLHSNANKKVLNKMKDENGGCPVVEFVGLRAKMYSMLVQGEEGKMTENKRAKGVGRVAIEGHTHQDYLDCVNGDRPQQRASCARIGVKDHVLYSFITNKISLCSFDDKRYILDDGITTLAHGHKSI